MWTCCAPAPAFARILLNEVLYDPPGSDGGHEFVELISQTDSVQSLAGLRLEFCNGSTPGDWRLLWEGAAQDSLSAGGLFLLGESEHGGADCVLTLGMQNGPEALRLSRDGVVLDLLGYGEGLAPELYEAWPAPDPASRSLARRPDGVDTDQNALDWFAADPTPGALNLPEFRVRLKEAVAPFPPVPPGEPLLLRIRAENDGAAAWPTPVRLQVIDPLSPALLVGSGELSVCLPGHSSESTLLLPPPPPGRTRYSLYAGLPAEPVADSLSLEIRVGVGPLLLSELLFAPVAPEPEWVECWAGEPLNGLDEFVLADLSGSETRFTPPPLAAGQRLLITADAPALLGCHPDLPADRVLELSPWPSLANSGVSDAPGGWTDGLCLDDGEGFRSDGVLYRGEWIPARGVSLERLSYYPRGGLSPWSPCPMGSSPLAGPELEPEFVSHAELSLEPNPFDPDRERLSISINASGDELHLHFFDAAGRFVQSLSGRLGSGRARLIWDGCDRMGRPLPDGAYPFLLEWESESGTRCFREGVCALRRGR